MRIPTYQNNHLPLEMIPLVEEMSLLDVQRPRGNDTKPITSFLLEKTDNRKTSQEKGGGQHEEHK